MIKIDWNATAACVQAAGSIVAIVAAFWVGSNQSKQAEKLYKSRLDQDELERRDQERRFAVYLAALFTDSSIVAADKAELLARAEFHEGKDVVLGEQIQSDFVEFLDLLSVEWEFSKPHIVELVSRLPNDCCIKVYNAIRTANFIVARFSSLKRIALMGHMTDKLAIASTRECGEWFETMRSRCLEATHALQVHYKFTVDLLDPPQDEAEKESPGN
ncbi:hypothetical protein [Pseudoxanthomonas winnipegensis]|uniref:DUF4760 domain-containing protein n=1 Tax=Pseudoxanthomonas winnipegensis TaxID=2480810 RepID=A0A4Q8LN82_9GAMM|nr:hypothetical protein [Pseudoxanthomonas winnipegensis]RZZ83465.1 hypothetical protein EA663_16500 [Pseudoxanthomonas winnipegensis]TAA31717.1 hypothetical protein EA656_17975 [Pseudoxanthomonas winnipegensis]